MRYMKTIPAVLAGAMLMLALSGCAGSQPKDAVALGEATQGQLTGNIAITGTLAPKQSAAVSTQISGLVAAIPVKEGTMVKQGQLLVLLDSKDSQAQLAKSQTKITQTQFTIQQTKTALDDATKDLNRYQELYAAGGASAKQLESYKTAWTNAKLNYDAAVKATMPSAQEEAKIASLTLDKSRIVSPIDGMVVAVTANIGENVQPGAALVTVVNTSVLELTGNIGEEEVSCLNVGQKCDIAADAVPGKSFPAQVSFVSPISLASGSSFPVRLQVDNNAGTLRAGMNASASISINQSGWIVPSTAVFEENGKSYIFANNDGKAKKTAVMTGLRAKGKVVILSGFDGSMKVVTKGADGLLDGDAISAK